MPGDEPGYLSAIMNRSGRRSSLCLVVLAAITGGAECGKDNRPATWEYISPIIFQPNCATGSCHSPAAAAAGLDFSDPDRGYTSLTALWVWIVDPKGTPDNGCMVRQGTVVCQRNQRPLVVAFDPSQSRLVNVLRAEDAPRMPPDRPLAEGDVELVERWILNGAPRTAGGPAAGAPAPKDAAPEASSDAATDASTDGGADAAKDASADAAGDGPTTDAATDGPKDAASEAAVSDAAGAS